VPEDIAEKTAHVLMEIFRGRNDMTWSLLSMLELHQSEEGSMPKDFSEDCSLAIQVTNIAPQAAKDQMVTLFSFLGKFEDLRLYPTMRDAIINI